MTVDTRGGSLTGVGNPLGLNAEELNVIRGLQDGAQLAEAHDPIWEGLEDLGLVEERETMSGSDMALARIRTLTLAGVDYPTG